MRQIIAVAFLLLALAFPAPAQDFGTTRPCQGACTEFDPPAPDYNLCRIACDNDPSCKQWTYSERGHFGYETDKCFLIPRLTEPVKHPCCVSDVKVAQEDSDKAELCRDFATRAISASGENLRLRCGFTGPRWSPDRRVHFAWCMVASASERLAEENFRENKIAQCKGGGDGEAEACKRYAQDAVIQAEEAAKLACGFKGERWTTIYTRHFNFCRVSSEAERAAETSARDAELKQCRSDKTELPREEDCRGYAEEAIQSQSENERFGCGFEGPRWSSTYKEHFRWCMRVSKAESDKEREARRRAIRRCRETSSDGDAERSEACRRYADEAVADQAENKRLACGLVGELWRSSPAYHYDWCMTVGRRARVEANEARKSALDQCRSETGGGGDRAQCKDYAAAAVRDFAENRRLGCGFEGARWSPDPRYHFDWCAGAPEAARGKQAKVRANLLAMCADHPKRAANCRAFSNLALDQQRRNLARGCGFTGPRWNSDYETHWLGCMSMDGLTRGLEAAAREAALASCKRK